jgi:hypothetical protein
MTVSIENLLRAKASMGEGKSTPEALAEYNRVKAALNQEALDNWHNPAWHREQAAILEERFDFGFQFDNLFPTYFETETVGEFDQVTFTERRGMKVFSTARGGYVDETELQTERWTLPRDSMGFHVKESDWRLRANYAETLEQLAELGTQRMDAEINRRIFTMLQASVPSNSPYYINASGGLTKQILDQALRGVLDAPRANNVGRQGLTIIGRSGPIDEVSNVITNSSNGVFDPEGTALIREKGFIDVYKGANVIRLQNFTDENDQSYIPDDELWVFGGTVGKFVKYGGVRVNSWAENTVEYRHIQARLDIGGAIFYPRFARRIILGDLTA